ncbi:MAG: 4Fe-4S binding protein [Vicinamibacterales bacterium]
MGLQYIKRQAQPIATVRRGVQAAFLALNAWIGVQFYLWVRYFESGGAAVYVPRPPGVEGWLPIASLMNLKYFLLTYSVPDVHPAGMFLLIAFVGTSVVFRKAFCSWMCPIGTLSEWLWQGGAALSGGNRAFPRWVDIPLRSLKYILLALVVWVVVTMPVPALAAFLSSPYGLVADVKMLDFFRDAGRLTIQVCSVLVILSVVTKNFWCRFLCPYGALMGLASLSSPMRITRDPAACIDCGKCAKACPSLIPVDVLRTVRTPECNGCLTCVSVCPVQDALEMRTLVGRRRVAAPRIALGLALIFVAVVGYAKITGHWHGQVQEDLFFKLIPIAGTLSHP